jgi:hypothetical protein
MQRLKRWIGAALVAACGDAGNPIGGETGASTGDATTTPPSTTTTSPTSTPTSEPPTTPPTSDTSTEPLDPTTGPATTTSPGTTTTTTTTTTTASQDTSTGACTCTPGELFGCIDVVTADLCAADCISHEPTACDPGQACLDGQGCVVTACVPGELQCAGEASTQQCKPDGSDFDDPVDCAVGEGCEDGVCTALCVLAELSPRSLGCSFFARTMDNYYPVDADSVIVGNTHPSLPATVQLYVHMNGAELPVGAAELVAPGEVHEFQLTEPEIDGASEVRANGAYRVESDLPIVAYQHAPRGAQLTNDASMLLPEPALARNYVIASAREGTLHKSHRSYFVVIPTTDDTTVTWTPPVDTIAGIGVPAVTAGQTGEVTLDRLETLQVAAAFTVDLTGTYVSADKPIWVIGASACTSEPVGNHTCDHIEEQMLPIDYWGKTYVAAHAPKRGAEKYHWRVFGGADGVQITTTPDQTGGPFTLMKGEFKVITTSAHFVFTGDGPFLPVQYLESQTAGAGTGDPSTVQMIPVEQFLGRYVFATGVGYTTNYVQIIREIGGAAVTVDGVQVAGYVPIGGYELADWTIAEGSHVAESADPFAIINIGYTNFTSYAYPGGMKLDVITPQ